jgi:hypothetical protein
MPIQHVEVLEVRENERAVALQGAQQRVVMLGVALGALGAPEAAIHEKFGHDADAVDADAARVQGVDEVLRRRQREVATVLGAPKSVGAIADEGAGNHALHMVRRLQQRAGDCAHPIECLQAG